MKDHSIDPQSRAELLRGEARPSDVSTASAGNVTVSLSSNDGFIVLNWNNSGTIGKYDYVALFQQNPARVGAKGYLTRQWAYVDGQAKGSYQTATASAEGYAYWIAYCTYDYGTSAYQVVLQVGPQDP